VKIKNASEAPLRLELPKQPVSRWAPLMRLFTTEVFLFALETAAAPRRARSGFRLHVETRSDCLLHAHSLRFSRTDRLHPGPDGLRSQPLLYHSGSGPVNTFLRGLFLPDSARSPPGLPLTASA
jgi:hypothetical protein